MPEQNGQSDDSMVNEARKKHGLPVKRSAPARTDEPSELPPTPSPKPNEIPRPEGVPDTHHLMWVDAKPDPKTGRSLARDMHEFYGAAGHVIPHHFAPIHAMKSVTSGPNDVAAGLG